MTAITQHFGFYWPAADKAACHVVHRDCRSDIKSVMEHVPERRICVQAGACVGVYPLALADLFSQVITFEPDPLNWACLEKNLQVRDVLRRVTAHNAALGEAEGVCAPTVVEAANCGANRVTFDAGDTPVKTIDSLSLAICDLIWLDLEGSELFALRGAVETIKRCSPTISIEDKGLDGRFFGVAGGAAPKFLADIGYSQVGAYGRDKIFRRAT